MITQRLKFADLGEIFDGPHATPKRRTHGPYFLNIASLLDGRLDLTKSDHVSSEDFARWTRRVAPQEGDLLFSYETRLGEAALMPGGVEACLGRRMALLRPNRERVAPRFLLYLYLSPVIGEIIDRHMIHGATVNRIGLSTMGSWPVDIPALPEQRAIAGVLGAIDDKIAVNTRLGAALAMLATAIFEQALVRGSKEQEISELTSLVARGITPTYSILDESVTVLNQKCVREHAVLLGPARKTLLARVREEKMLRQDDVLINSTGDGTLGRVARWTYDSEATVDSHVSIVRFDDRVVDPTCGGYGVLRLQPLIEQMGEGSTGQTELSRAELGKVRVRLPDRGIQFALGKKLGTLSKHQDALRSENDSLREMRDELLPHLISGKIRVKDAEKTVEEVL